MKQILVWVPDTLGYDLIDLYNEKIRQSAKQTELACNAFAESSKLTECIEDTILRYRTSLSAAITTLDAMEKAKDSLAESFVPTAKEAQNEPF